MGLLEKISYTFIAIHQVLCIFCGLFYYNNLSAVYMVQLCEKVMVFVTTQGINRKETKYNEDRVIIKDLRNGWG